MSFRDLEKKKKGILIDIVGIDTSKQVGNWTFGISRMSALKKGELKEILLKEEVH